MATLHTWYEHKAGVLFYQAIFFLTKNKSLQRSAFASEVFHGLKNEA